jgi:hypothetical protein
VKRLLLAAALAALLPARASADRGSNDDPGIGLVIGGMIVGGATFLVLAPIDLAHAVRWKPVPRKLAWVEVGLAVPSLALIGAGVAMCECSGGERLGLAGLAAPALLIGAHGALTLALGERERPTVVAPAVVAGAPGIGVAGRF